MASGHHNLFCPRFYRMCAQLEASSPHELSSRFDSFHFDREVVNGELASTWFWSKVVWIVLTNSDDPINRLRDPKDPLQLHLWWHLHSDPHLGSCRWWQLQGWFPPVEHENSFHSWRNHPKAPILGIELIIIVIRGKLLSSMRKSSPSLGQVEQVVQCSCCSCCGLFCSQCREWPRPIACEDQPTKLLLFHHHYYFFMATVTIIIIDHVNMSWQIWYSVQRPTQSVMDPQKW